MERTLQFAIMLAFVGVVWIAIQYTYSDRFCVHEIECNVRRMYVRGALFFLLVLSSLLALVLGYLWATSDLRATALCGSQVEGQDVQ